MSATDLLKAQAALTEAIRELYGNGSADNLRAIANEVVLPMVEADVQAESLVDLVLERQPAMIGDVKWAKKPEHKAYFIDEQGNLVVSKNKKAFVTPEGYLVTAFPTVNRLDMERGYVAGVTDQVAAAKKDIIKKLNGKLMLLLSASAVNIVGPTGASVTEDMLNLSFQYAEDVGLEPAYILMRGSRFNDIRGFTLPDLVDAELVRKGVRGVSFSGARPILNPEVPSKELYLICNEKPGRVMDEFPLRVGETTNVPGTLDLSVEMFQVVKMAITNPTRFVKIILS